MVFTVKMWNQRHQELIAEFARGLARGDESGPGADAVAQALESLGDLAQTHFYLTRTLGPDAKRACVRAHYGLLLDRLSRPALLRLIEANVPLWTLNSQDMALRIDLRLEHWVAREGELTLEIFAERKMLYLMTFSFAPAALFGADGDLIILVSRVQGRPGEFDDIRAATKAMSEVAPRAALFAALAGIARAASVRHVLGVAAENHVGYEPAKREMLVRQYDDFFLALDGAPHFDGFFLIDLEAEPKPVTAQKTGHRVRTRRKREFKAGITASVGEAWSTFCARAEAPAA